jgi:signal transduction histidine kinase
MNSSFERVKNGLVLRRFWERLQELTPHWKWRGARWRKPREPVQIEAPAPHIVDSFRNFSKWASIIAMIVGYHVLLAWTFDIHILKTPSPSYSMMKGDEALCSILAGGALYLLQLRRGAGARRFGVIIRLGAGLTGVIALVALWQFIFGGPPTGGLGFGTQQSAWSGMTLTSSLGFLMIGISLLVLDRPRRHRWAEALALVSAAISMLAIAGYLYQAEAFQGQMPLYAAVVIFLVSGGIFCVRADRGLMAKVTSNSFGGIMARRLLPATLLIPLVLGWLQHEGQRAGLYEAEPGLALFTVADVALFLLVIWWGVNSLHRMDTKRRQAEYELQETAAKLARSNADLEQFAYVASHDLKEPLRAISGSVQILQERYSASLDGDADEVIKHTVDGATRMQTLIDDLLTYSRLSTREAPLESADCSRTVQTALANLEMAIQESKAVITHDVLPVIKGDPTQLLQVFQNLINNAIKYRSERTLKIHVGAEEHESEWLFSVRDNGIGIAPQYATRIFRIFQRLHTRKEYSGTGIGLAVCKKIVERHGGRIWVESEPEEGSTFYFTLAK